MKKLPLLIAALATLGTAALAADDPVAVRKALLDSNAASAGVAGAIMKDELAYSPAVGKSVIMAWNAVAASVGDYFPEGTAGPDNESDSSPKIWEDMAGFEAALVKFQTDVAAAVAASGKDGPADKAAFATAAQQVLGNCKACHDNYRIPD
jgi:cytochrome c556